MMAGKDPNLRNAHNTLATVKAAKGSPLNTEGHDQMGHMTSKQANIRESNESVDEASR